MRNYLTITITEVTGSRHYALHKSVKRMVQYAFLALLAGILFGISLIVFLTRSVQDLETKRSAISQKLSFMMEENGSLINQINHRIAEFEEIDDKIAFIEEMIGMQGTADLSLSERMEIASLAIASREKEFKELGAKVENIEGMFGIEKKGEKGDDGKSLMERVDIASITATQKKLMLDSIPNGSPITHKGLSSGFGNRIHPTLNRPEFHPGLDMRAPQGTEVFATADGVVELAGKDNDNGYGVLVILRHNYGFRTTFGHLSKVAVQAGDFVKKGDLVAYSGNTGLSSGPHLHYEVRFLHTTLNPAHFVEWNLDNYEVVFREKQVKWPSLVSLINQRLTDQTPQSLQLAQR